MSKLSFRARALDAFKSMPIYLTEELPDLPEYSAINRAVPQMPSGMDKEEEREHHFQRAIITGLIIPTPEVTKAPEYTTTRGLPNLHFKPFKQLIRMQPFAMEEEYPDYDMDSEDERWLSKQKLEITPLKFEEMMDRLEKNCAQNFASQDRKELLLKDDDELSIAIYDYWLSKRLKIPTPLVPHVRTEVNRFGNNTGNNNPYLAFRRRTEKMQTRKNRKNDEASYEKMIKLKRDLGRVLQLLELVKRREVIKKELVKLTIRQYEKRYEANDFSGALLAELSAIKPSPRPAFAPIFSNQYTSNHTPPWYHKPKEDLGLGRKEKRQYKRRKHKALGVLGPGEGGKSSGDEDLPPSPLPPSPASSVSDPPISSAPPLQAFPFNRNKFCQYHPPVKGGRIGNWRWTGPEDGGRGDERFRYSLTSLATPTTRCIGLARRRIGRGGRVILDRAYKSMDDFWSSVDFNILDSANISSSYSVRHFKPKVRPESPPVICDSIVDSDALCGSALNLQVECAFNSEVSSVELNLNELFPDTDVETLKSELFGGVSSGSGGSCCGTPGGSVKRSLLQRVTEESPVKAVSSVASLPEFSHSPSDHDYVGCSLFTFTDRTRTNSASRSTQQQQQQILVNTSCSSSSSSSCNKVDNIQFVIGTSEALHLPSNPAAAPTTNGPTSTDIGISWLEKSGGGLPVVLKGGYSPGPVLNSKLSGRSTPQTHIVTSENMEDSLAAKTSTPSLVNSHAMEVT